VGERIQAELARLIREQLRDPRVGFVTLTGVTLSSDLRHAKVYFSVLGDEPAETLAALEHATPFLRHQLARAAGLKHTPSLLFQVDSSIVGGQRIESILDDLDLEPDTDGGDGA
jgi:ribosome-binding factor A